MENIWYIFKKHTDAKFKISGVGGVGGGGYKKVSKISDCEIFFTGTCDL